MARTGVVQRRLKPPTGPPSWFRETVGLGNPPGSNHASLGARWPPCGDDLASMDGVW
jgi:hypothetical protein